MRRTTPPPGGQQNVDGESTHTFEEQLADLDVDDLDLLPSDLLEPFTTEEDLLAVPVALPDEVLPPSAIPEAAGPSQVAVWRGGRQVRLMEHAEAQDRRLMVLDVGSEWVPLLFRSAEGFPHAYEEVFADLANGRFSDDAQGRRARRDRYLEVYGIPPSPTYLSQRFFNLDARQCVREVPAEPLVAFEGAVWHKDGRLEPEVERAVVDALQTRLVCETHLRSNPSGHLGSRTRWALEEFERRNRIYARGRLQGETLEALQADPLELERRALVRTLTERLVLELAVVEDGSAAGIAPAGGAAPREVRLGKSRNMVRRIERALVRSLGLRDVAATRRFYRRMHSMMLQKHYFIAIPAPRLPSYHADNMDLFVEIDRGDIYYDFPYDDDGSPRLQPIEQHPVLTLFARPRDVSKRGKRADPAKKPPNVIPLAHYGTTIGGWRIQRVRDADLWTYKESPVGPRVWSRIVSAPVWLPPAKTPPSTLVYEGRRDEEGNPVWVVNENLVGPGYASAYGLVAAYHQQFTEQDDHRVPTRDQGIRSHGSSDYTSIWQRASLGCHRLYNHLALRLFNFIIAHRPHRRSGHRSASFRMPVALHDFETVIEVDRTGYGFVLREPLEVDVLPGRVLGERKRSPNFRVPVERKATP